MTDLNPSAQFIKILFHYKKIGYNIGGWLRLLSGPPGFNCWISYAPVSKYMYC